jgi:hypothetical protein
MMNGVQKQTKSFSKMTYSITKKGQVIEFDSAFESAQEAKKYASEFLGYNTFVMDLIAKINLTFSQESWLHYLATESLNNSLFPTTEKEDGPYISLVKKMYECVKSPTRKFQVHIPGGITLATVTKGLNVGHVYVFENGNYSGKITPEGVLKAEVCEDTLNLLEDANENLLKLAQMYGHETSQCSICNRPLSDKISIQLGMGQVCYKRFKQV